MPTKTGDQNNYFFHAAGMQKLIDEGADSIHIKVQVVVIDNGPPTLVVTANGLSITGDVVNDPYTGTTMMVIGCPSPCNGSSLNKACADTAKTLVSYLEKFDIQ